MCISLCTTVVHNTARAVLIIFPLILQTIIIAQMMSTGREEVQLIAKILPTRQTDKLKQKQNHFSRGQHLQRGIDIGNSTVCTWTGCNVWYRNHRWSVPNASSKAMQHVRLVTNVSTVQWANYALVYVTNASRMQWNETPGTARWLSTNIAVHLTAETTLSTTVSKLIYGGKLFNLSAPRWNHCSDRE